MNFFGAKFFLFIGIFLLLTIVIDLSYEINYLYTPSSSEYTKIPKATVAIVFGAAVYGKKPSPVLKDRLKAALILYQNKRVDKILLSGDNSTKDYNEIRPMLNYMLKNKVKKEDIFVDYAGFRTLDTLMRAKYIFKVEDAIIVTQRFHQPRAVYIASKMGIKVASYEADQRVYKDRIKNRMREFFARNLAWYDLNLLNTHPKFLGEIHPISEGGNSTWDYQ
jgi:SanA protein